jgi:FkbM family methyltransferase
MSSLSTQSAAGPKTFNLSGNLAKLRCQPRPLRFLASRFLWHTGLGSFLTIPRSTYRLRFYPTAYSATLWLNPAEHLGDEVVLRSLLHEGDSVIDVGANIGTLTLAASKIVGPTGKVYSIEAHPRTHKYLLGNLEFNKISNVQAFNVACGREHGTARVSSNVSDDQNSVSPEGVSVPVRKLDDLLTGTETQEIALLKIDVEGYEKFVLEGSLRLLWRVKFIYFESYERHAAAFGYELRDIIDVLEQFRFGIYRLNGDRVSRDDSSAVCENLLASRSRPPKIEI